MTTLANISLAPFTFYSPHFGMYRVKLFIIQYNYTAIYETNALPK